MSTKAVKAAKPPKKKNQHIGEERISLRHEFTDKEYRDIGGKLNIALNTLGQLENDLAAISKDYKARIAQQEGIRDELNNKLGNGYEMRETTVQVIYEPAKRTKTYYALDDKKRKKPLGETDMRPSDFQLDWLDKSKPATAPQTPAASEANASTAPVTPENPASTNVGEAVENAAATKKLLDDAIEVIRSESKASVSLIQRRLRISHVKAVEIIAGLEKDGVIGPANGSEPRAILNLPPAQPPSGTPQHDTSNPPPVPSKKTSDKRKPTVSEFREQQEARSEGDK